MLKFINKIGKKVLEMKDNGDLKVLSEDLKKQGLVADEEKKKEEPKKEEGK